MGCEQLSKERNGVCLFKLGGVPAGADAFETIGVPLIVPDAGNATEMLDLVGTGKMNGTEEVLDKERLTANVTLNVPVRGMGSASVPKVGVFLKAAGFAEDTGTTDKAIYTLSSSAISDSYLTTYSDGVKSTADAGGINLALEAGVNNIPKIIVNYSGYTDAAKTIVAAPTLTLDTGEYFRFKNSTVITVGGSQIMTDKVSFDVGNVISETYGSNIKCFMRTNFNPVLTVEAWREKDNAVAWTHFLNEDLKEIVSTFEAPNGEILEVKASYAKARVPALAAGDGNIRETRSYKLENEAALVITFDKTGV